MTFDSMRPTVRPTLTAAALGALLGFAACQVKFRDDVVYRCAADSDCAGDEFKCAVTQGVVGVCCKPTGPEVCDKVDNDCNGPVDDTGKTEVCNTQDDDCNGLVDDGFDLANDPTNCGVCGRTCQTGFVCRGGNCTANVESVCFDGIDNNNDGKADCEDSSCELRSCGAGCVCKALKKTESLCSDGRDNDGDGRSDCRDPDCTGGSCAIGCTCVPDGGVDETDCTDGVDNDKDSLIDCLDPDCVGRFCTPPQIYFQCTASQQCKCNGGVQIAEVGSVYCRDDVDNDCNGVKDCGETTCAGQSCSPDGGAACTCAGNKEKETDCTNRADDDGDGLIDCVDTDCPLGTRCTTLAGDAGTCTSTKTCQ